MAYLLLPDQQSPSFARVYSGDKGILWGCRKEEDLPSICLLCNRELQLNPAAFTVALRTGCTEEGSRAGR